MRNVTGFLSSLVITCVAVPALADQIRCPAGGIAIQGASAEDVDDACVAVIAAIRFFRDAGLPEPRGGSIRLVGEQNARLLAPHELGVYDARENTINVLDYQSAVRATQGRAGGLGRVSTRAHWQSFIVHELAHAAVHAGCDRTCPSRAAHECVAAIAQIVSLPQAQLDALLSASKDIEAYGSLAEVSDLYYEIDPHRFAVKCYKQYRRQTEPRAYFRRMLNLQE